MTQSATQAAGARYTTRILRSPEEIAAVAAECARCRRRQRRPQADLGFEFAPSSSDQYRVGLLYDRDEITGFAWLKIGVWSYPWRIRLAGRSRMIARFRLLSADYRDNDLVAPDDEEARRLLLRAMLDACADCAVLRVWFVGADSDLWRLVKESRARRGGRWIVVSWQPTPHWHARLGSSFEGYLHKFSGKTRTKLRRRLRMLGELAEGEVALETVTARDQVPEFLQQALGIADQSARPDAIRAEIGSAETARVLECLADAGRLRCYTMTAGGRPVAFLAGWMSGDTYCMYRTGFDRRWESCSPGSSLIYLVIEDLHRLPHARVLDFGHGHWDYKQFFSSESFTELGVFLVRPGVASAVAFVPILLSQALKALALRMFGRLRRRPTTTRVRFRRGSQPEPSESLDAVRSRRSRSDSRAGEA